ncbi:MULTISPECIES: TetR/AcrR family transcriptional regulator [unclassified Nocardia]|uniref:TetR/AcrR family transcriptional regulator n=1 Tax=unclassified Nocardia TaxID=2637762 RepID=UPI00278C0E85|nr:MULTISPECIES: TetR/AcrR family transcriptional regulator [unclassified Nocardia]
MPRHVDHESRRRLIADAVCGLIGRRGLEAATLREVAAAAGVSMGAVQRCFETRQQMLIFAQEHVNQRVAERARTRIAASAEPESVLTLLEQTLDAMLVVDDPDLVEASVWLAFSAQAAVDPVVAAAQRDHYRGLAELLVLLLRLGVDGGLIRSEVDPEQVGEDLIALADGLTIQVLTRRRAPESVRATLRRHLAELRV